MNDNFENKRNNFFKLKENERNGKFSAKLNLEIDNFSEQLQSLSFCMLAIIKTVFLKASFFNN